MQTVAEALTQLLELAKPRQAATLALVRLGAHQVRMSLQERLVVPVVPARQAHSVAGLHDPAMLKQPPPTAGRLMVIEVAGGIPLQTARLMVMAALVQAGL
ncbi:hypothetical protein [Pantoea brenneri]|uniref:hypothetical protein n=1 Tax=Pantoea brenneri TaxID=472694 RepID=UPI00289C17DC|nr:hypothetical protein [Pantoea brenneri]